MVETSAIPFGYTATIWCCGAMLMHFRGQPNVGDVFAFLAGALGGFTALGALGARTARRTEPLSPGPAHLMAGMLHWVAAGLAVGSGALLAEIPSWLAWPAVSLAATAIFLIAGSLQLAAAAAGDRQRSR